MIPALQCGAFGTLKRRTGSSRRRCGIPALLLSALIFPSVAVAQSPLLNPAATRSSASGQFVVIGANPVWPPVHLPLPATNSEFVRLEPGLLAVSAGRVKRAVWTTLGIDPLAAWSGKIFLALHPAQSLHENVSIISTRFNGAWNYRVELPDVVSRVRLTRALTAVVLLDLANRDNDTGRSPEIPSWLTEGLAQQLLAEKPTLILSAPDKLVNGLPEDRITIVERGVDPLARARRVLHAHPALTFDQLSWPDGAQLTGQDDGVYRASAQLFVSKLLKLNGGPAHLRALLRLLPRYYNWQFAFRKAFAADFPRPIDLAKWWALQTASFAARGAGPLWTAATSRERLDDILSVPVELRSSPTNLPAHTAVSLQAVIHNFGPGTQTAVLQAKLRELDQAQWRMAPQFAVLTEAYHHVLKDYLNRLANGVSPRWDAANALNKLNALDARRRTVESGTAAETAAGQQQ